jgi:hypothetical protein
MALQINHVGMQDTIEKGLKAIEKTNIQVQVE